MEAIYYEVSRIEGEYAYLKEIGGDNEIFIAMALLPPCVDICTKLKYEMLEYTVVENE